MTEFIPVNEPLLDGNEKKYLMECIESGWISSEGPFVRKFEKQFAALIGREYAIAVTNGTAALDASVEALGIGPGDEVILPAFTIISCINQIVRSGAKPVLIDCDPVTWNMDVTQIESKITPNTKAIMLVHIYGLPVDIDPVLDIAQRNNLKVIEDAAEMIGQTYKGKPCGSFGDISTISFYPNKLVTTGEGGMIFTDNEDLAEKCRSLRNLCFQNDKRFIHETLGWNLRMTNLQAAVGLAQLEKLEESINRKRKIGTLYTERLKDLDILTLPIEETTFAKNIYWVYGLLINDNKAITTETAMKKLAKEGIGTRPFFYPLHKQPALNKLGLFHDEHYPVAEKIYEQGFYIPSGLSLTTDKVEKVAKKITNLFKGLT